MSAGRRAWLSFGLLAALAVAVRALMLPYPHLDADMAMTGLMARHILEGEFPIFFWGQPYCGAIEAYLAAPVFALLGSSRLTLCATVALVSLVFVGLAYAAAKDMWGRRAGLFAMLLAALPPAYFLAHNVLPRAAYIEVPTLSLLLGWLAWRLGRGRAPAWEYLAYGLAAGLGFWTHFLIAYALLGSALYILLADWRVLLRKSLPLMLAGFFLGSLPLWVYNLEEPLATFLYLTRPKFHVGSWEAFWRVMLDGVCGVLAAWAGGRGADPRLAPFYYAAGGLGLASLGWLVWQRRRALAGLARLQARYADGSEVWLLILLAALAVTVLSGESASYTLRHLVPVYAAVIPLGGYLLDRLWRKGFKALAGGLLALMLAGNLAGLYQSANIFHPERYHQYQTHERANLALAQSMLDHGVRHAFTWNYWDAYIITFDAAEKVILDSPAHSHYPPYMRALLRDAQTGFVVPYDARPYEEPLQAAGARYKRFKSGEFTCFYDIDPPAHGLEEIAKTSWRLSARPLPALVGQAVDGAVTTWVIPAGHPGPAWLQLDLGRVEQGLCLLRLLPGTPGESPVQLRLETSLDAKNWSPASTLAGYRWPLTRAADRIITDFLAPRQDLYFTPRPARYLRLSMQGLPLEQWWRLAEISLYRAGGAYQALRPDPLIQEARRLGLATLYAEQDLAASLPGDLAQRNALSPGPADWPEKLAPQILLPEDLSQVGLVMEPYQMPALRGTLSLHGLAWRESRAGGYFLLHGLRRAPLPLGAAPLVERARSNGADEAKAFDADPATRWTTARPRTEGDFLELALKEPVRLAGLALDYKASPHDAPSGLILELSADGRAWQAAGYREVTGGPLVFAGDRVLASAGNGWRALFFEPQQVKGLRLTSPSGSKEYYFSVHELRLIPEAPRP